MGLRLLCRSSGFVQTIDLQVRADEIRVREPTPGIELRRLLCPSKGLVVIAQSAVDGAQVAGRNVVARVGLRPQLIGLARSFQVPGDEMFIARGDVKLFALAYPFTQRVGLASILGATGVFALVGVAYSQKRVCHGKVGVQAGGSLEQRNSGSEIGSLICLVVAQAVSLQRLKRWCGHVLRWRVVLLH